MSSMSGGHSNLTIDEVQTEHKDYSRKQLQGPMLIHGKFDLNLLVLAIDSTLELCAKLLLFVFYNFYNKLI